jgi:hypothetical protein
MRSRAWAWLIALVALVLAVCPLVAMSGVLGLGPMSTATANVLWIAAIVLTVVSFGMSLRQGLRTRTRA